MQIQTRLGGGNHPLKTLNKVKSWLDSKKTPSVSDVWAHGSDGVSFLFILSKRIHTVPCCNVNFPTVNKKKSPVLNTLILALHAQQKFGASKNLDAFYMPDILVKKKTPMEFWRLVNGWLRCTQLYMKVNHLTITPNPCKVPSHHVVAKTNKQTKNKQHCERSTLLSRPHVIDSFSHPTTT